MKHLSRSLFIFLALPLAIRAAEPPKGQRVFSAGHSFHMMVPDLLAEIAKSAGVKDHQIAGRQGLGGSRTLQHWDLPDDKNIAKKTLKTGTVDVLTLSPHLQLPDEGIDNFVNLALEQNPNSCILVQGSWMAFDDPNNIGKKFANEDRNQAKIEDLRQAYGPFAKEIDKQLCAINKRHEEKCKRPVVFLVPVGYAVVNLREKVVAGQAPGIEKQSDLFNDSIGHAKAPIAVLNAYCHFAVIYKQNPVGLPVPIALRKMAKAEELNKLLQEIAWDTVTKEPLSGVK